ncbi:hypothetical protein DBR32_06780 [Taibaiella sp. KBW10]|uniref:exodeoxyribonuclease V subunit gamma n=1 Tax=Taibaiella sp. KBW10 TaxID=2153357 RepID=UPI000F5A8D7E|nr:exodeoxyribonuclease V subunit gamma [Taibaiella sp. KBW10]RQO31650.1 hypothetical protein DBR32_06780 [Taibaiella sp. KBW10]
MALEIYISNHIRSLSAAMIDDFKHHGAPVLQPYYIITQTIGMNNWLVVNTANQLGIAANMKFLKPADILWEVYGLLGGQSYYKINRQNIDWLIYAVLSSAAFRNRFPKQAAYYIEEGVEQDVKKWEFAAKIADLFDQYQIYRNHIMQQWNTQAIEDIDPVMQWQAFIWQAIKSKSGEAFPDITAIHHFILAELKHPVQQERIRQAMPVLYLFGLSILTPFHLHIFYELSRVIDFKCYLVNPAPDHYWFEDEQEQQIFLKQFKGKNVAHLNVGNALLTSWGKVLQNTYRLLFRSDEFINAVNELPITQPAQGSLLQQVQYDIFYNKTENIQFTEAQLRDKTISITAHYSIPREVEVLYNYLLDAVIQQTYGAITERDIVVMVSDINAYAPYIRAVFDNAPHKFSYSIIDESIANGDTVISALILLLQVNEYNFTAELVLQLLESEHIRRRFGIYKMEYIRKIVLAANIRFGIDNDYQEGIDDTYLVSWKYGLQKLMFGMCFDESQWYVAGRDVYTTDIADNIEDMHQITALSSFVQALEETLKRRKVNKNLSDWKTYVDDLIMGFVIEEEQEKDEQYWDLITRFKQNEIIDAYLDDTKISYEVFSKRLLNAISGEQQSLNFMNRGITFCSPLPFRSIPFKIIALLGLNFDAFPRKESYVDFDLMIQKPMLGDRNIRNNDKHLFLESVLSAESALYLSYIGRSIKDNKPLPPSVLIDELLDYIQIGYRATGAGKLRDLLIQQHPLHSFSKVYNQADRALIPNYLIQEAKPFPITFKATEAQVMMQEQVFSLKDLLQFFTKPTQYYYNKVLQVYINDTIAQVAAHENFTLDSLQRWAVRQALIEGKIHGDEAERLKALYANAILPLRNVAPTFIAEQDEAITQIYQQYQDFLKDTAPQSITVMYTCDQYVFTGIIDNILDGNLIDYALKASKRSLKNKVQLFLKYLLAKATEQVAAAFLITLDGILALKPCTKLVAQETLEVFLRFFIKHHKAMILFPMDLYEEKLHADNYLTKLEESIQQNRYYDNYIIHALPFIDEAAQKEYFTDFKDLLDQYILPAFDHA